MVDIAHISYLMNMLIQTLNRMTYTNLCQHGRCYCLQPSNVKLNISLSQS